MTIKFIQDNNSIDVASINDDIAFDKLPPKVYRVSFQEMRGFFLEHVVDQFKLPPKLYGSTQERIQKILATYNDRSSQTGVLLTGSKGTGKTILTEALCNEALASGLPVILISQPFTGANFFEFMNKLGECVVLFDEFGKVYTKYENEQESQQSLLSFLDGPYSSKRLLLFTENNRYDIDEFILNRPGRVYYHFEYDRVEEKVIQQYCEDYSIDEQTIKDLKLVATEIPKFSFDMLKHLVEEYNRFRQPIHELLEHMNINAQPFTYKYTIESIKDRTNSEVDFSQETYNENVLVEIYHKDSENSCTLLVRSSTPTAVKGNKQLHKVDGYEILMTKEEQPYNYYFAY